MKDYHVFQFDNFYPQGGWTDHTGSFSTLEEALEHVCNTEQHDNWQIVHDGQIVKSGCVAS